MPVVSDEMMTDALRAVRYVALTLAPKCPPGLSADDLESAGNEALVEAAATWDAAVCGWLTHARTVARNRMKDAVRVGRRHAARRADLEPETDSGDRLPRVDARALDPADRAAARELVSGPGRRTLSVRRLRGELPAPDVVADKVAELREAMFRGVNAADVSEVMATLVNKAKGGDHKATKLLLDYLQPPRSGVTVQQQAVVIHPGDVT